MRRAIVALAVGAVAGAAVVVVLEQPGKNEPARAAAEAASLAETRALPPSVETAAPPAASIPARDGASNAQGGFASQRLRVYASVAALDDLGAIEARIEAAAAQPDSPRRDLELEALLARLAEIDPPRAMRLAQSLFLDDRFVVAAFTAAAAASVEDALAALASMRRPGLQRDVALALLDTLGDDEGTVERIAASLPASLRLSFEMRRLTRRAQRDPAGALLAAMRLENRDMLQEAVTNIAASSATASPVEIDALAQMLEAEDPDLARAFRSSALTRWARSDPAAALAFLEERASTLDGSLASNIASVAATADPERVLGLLDSLPSSARSTTQSRAIRAIAERDPLRAIQLFEALPAGQDRNGLARTVARSYAQQDPDAAMAWARSLRQPVDLMLGVIEGIAAVDFDRAAGLVLQELSAQGGGPAQASGNGGRPAVIPPTGLVGSLVTNQRAADAGSMTRLAEGLLALDSALGRSGLMLMLGSWMQADTARATDWLLANLTRVPPETLNNVSRTLARTDIESAKRLTDSIPDTVRASWAANVAGTLAESGIANAMQWVERFRGQPVYEAALSRIVQTGARYDAKAAAPLVEGLSPALRSEVSREVALQWAQQDPAAAARWFETIDDETTRSDTLGMAARLWAQRDAAAAERWARALADSDKRDAALGGVFAGRAASGAVDLRLLDEIGAATVRQWAAMTAISALGNEPEAARELLPYVTSAAMRRQAELMIEQGER